eukprot:12408746-Karenia_brevis.AAC.1
MCQGHDLVACYTRERCIHKPAQWEHVGTAVAETAHDSQCDHYGWGASRLRTHGNLCGYRRKPHVVSNGEEN